MDSWWSSEKWQTERNIEEDSRERELKENNWTWGPMERLAPDRNQRRALASCVTRYEEDQVSSELDKECITQFCSLCLNSIKRTREECIVAAVTQSYSTRNLLESRFHVWWDIKTRQIVNTHTMDKHFQLLPRLVCRFALLHSDRWFPGFKDFSNTEVIGWPHSGGRNTIDGAQSFDHLN